LKWSGNDSINSKWVSGGAAKKREREREKKTPQKAISK